MSLLRSCRCNNDCLTFLSMKWNVRRIFSEKKRKCTLKVNPWKIKMASITTLVMQNALHYNPKSHGKLLNDVNKHYVLVYCKFKSTKSIANRTKMILLCLCNINVIVQSITG